MNARAVVDLQQTPDRAGFRILFAQCLGESALAELFAVAPTPTSDSDARRALLAAMGGTLYIPATRPDLVGDVLTQVASGVTSSIIDLEDGIRDDLLPDAWANVAGLLDELGRIWDGVAFPLALFVRVREAAEVVRFTDRVGLPRGLAGFVLPKCDGRSLRVAAEGLQSVGGAGLRLMPVVETVDFVRHTTRQPALAELAAAVAAHREAILAVRFGAVDLAGAFSVRLGARLSVHDVPMLAGALGDLTSVVSAPPLSIPVVGPVNEWYGDVAPTGAVRPASGHGITHLPWLMREAELDRAAGLWGKTVIHPIQALVVNAMAAVSWDDYRDALSILDSAGGGAQRSYSGLRMNEHRPHGRWAAATLQRAAACGVLRPHRRPADLLDHLMESYGAARRERSA